MISKNRHITHTRVCTHTLTRICHFSIRMRSRVFSTIFLPAAGVIHLAGNLGSQNLLWVGGGLRKDTGPEDKGVDLWANYPHLSTCCHRHQEAQAGDTVWDLKNEQLGGIICNFVLGFVIRWNWNRTLLVGWGMRPSGWHMVVPCIAGPGDSPQRKHRD